jgi:hypothetical protein
MVKSAAKPKKPTAKEYRALVTARLKVLKRALVEELRERIFVFPFPDGAKSLDFEIFEDTLDGAEGSPAIAGYFMDGNGGQVNIPKRGGRFEPYIEVLTSRQPLLTLPSNTYQRFEDAGVEGWRIHRPMIPRWFIDAWKAAGGK